VYEGFIDVFLPPLLTTEVMALNEPVDCPYSEREATDECGGGLLRPSTRTMFNKGSALIMASFLAFPAKIWLRILRGSPIRFNEGSSSMRARGGGLK
jgi:hypothetical protein